VKTLLKMDDWFETFIFIDFLTYVMSLSSDFNAFKKIVFQIR
jgi:hypothetical protein